VADQFRGIALLEIIYKLVSSIINRRLASKIVFHDAVHGFRKGRGTGTAIIEIKLRMQLAKRSTKPLFMVFLDLKKAYDTLDRDRTLKILEGYGVGPNLRRFIEKIWEGDTMVPKQSGYFGKPFQASRGVRQGDIVSPIIFNIVADAIIRDWEVQMVKNSVGRRETVSQFYADDGVLCGEDPKEVQRSLDLFTDGFARVGLKMNVAKTEAMIMKGGKIYTHQSDEAYKRRIEGTGPTHRERKRQKIQCDHCGASVNSQYLPTHRKTAKCQRAERPAIIIEPPVEPGSEATNLAEGATRPAISIHRPDELTEAPSLETGIPKTYRVQMPLGVATPCPAQGCVYVEKAGRRGRMRIHFRDRHPEDTIIVEEEGLLPQCTECGLFQRDVGPKHQATKDCKKSAATRQRRHDAVEQEVAEATIFYIDGRPIKNVKEFKYLGRILDDEDDDSPAIARNLKRARQKWGMIGRILSKEGASPQAMATFYKAILLSVLLYGSESWVISKSMLRSLESFHRRCARYITGRHIRENADGTWTCPDSSTTLSMAGLLPIDQYIRTRAATVMKYAKERFIYRRCLSSGPLASSVNQLVWWQQYSTDT
jgi:hypothetical protein